jgi:hypothetical protein
MLNTDNNFPPPEETMDLHNTPAGFGICWQLPATVSASVQIQWLCPNKDKGPPGKDKVAYSCTGYTLRGIRKHAAEAQERPMEAGLQNLWFIIWEKQITGQKSGHITEYSITGPESQHWKEPTSSLTCCWIAKCLLWTLLYSNLGWGWPFGRISVALDFLVTM